MDFSAPETSTLFQEVAAKDLRDGYEYLELLHRQNGKQTQSFTDFSVYLEAKARERGIPIHGQFELTPLCNFNCGMCYVHLNEKQFHGSSLLTIEQWKGLMHQAFENGMFQATLTGGECLTYPGFEELYLYLHSLGCQVDVLTNGSLLDENRIRFFREHPPALIQITLYGENEDVYERVTGRRLFHTVREQIRLVKDAGLPLIISITPNRVLGEDVFETIRLALGITKNIFINTSLFVPPGKRRAEAYEDPGVEYYTEILRFAKKLKGIPLEECPKEEIPEPGGPCHICEERGLECGGGRSGFVINWKGEMLICNRMEPRSFPLSDGFENAWRKIHEAAENWPHVPECRDCAYEKVCGKCAADVLKYSEAGKQPKGLCERTKYMVSRGVLPMPTCE